MDTSGSTMEKLSSLKGRRVILRDSQAIGILYEVVILELAPSGLYVKLRYSASDSVFWRQVSQLLLVEELPDEIKEV